jgi:hypothetical protein
MDLDMAFLLRRYFGRECPEHYRKLGEGVPCEWSSLVEKGEVVLGEYRNPPPFERTTIVFTEAAIYSFGDPPVRIPVDAVLDFESPADKVTISGLRIRTRDGHRFVRVAGPQPPRGNVKDAFMLAMLVMGIRQWQEARAKREGLK